MSEVSYCGVPSSVRFYRDGSASVMFDSTSRAFPMDRTEADKASAAMYSDPPREIEIIGDACMSYAVRLVPVVVVKARGKVCQIIDAECGRSPRIGLRGHSTMWLVANVEDVAIRTEVEIVSVDGGPDMVRRVS